VIRPFGLRDALLVRDLQRNSAVLAIEQALLHPNAPLWMALTAPWPWAGLGVATYILDERDGDGPALGFAQLLRRAARPEADLLYVAPALPPEDAHDARREGIWRRLLHHSCQAAAGRGLQRIFASSPEDGPETGCLKDVGFSLYTREVLYRLAADPATDGPRPEGASRPAGFRPQLPQDNWALQRLYTNSTPRLVQSAEGAVTGEVGSPPLCWWEPDRWRGLVWERANEPRGAVQVHIGRAGHWLRIWGVNALTAHDLRVLVEQGLGLIADAPRLWGRGPAPVYATVRDYEIGLGDALTGFGFAPYLKRARLVKHTVAVVRAPLPAALAAREIAVEAAAHIRETV